MTPILFNTEMVKAILDGRKTQTRRVVKDLPDDFPNGVGCDVVTRKVGDFWCIPTSAGYKKSPYGGIGDTLWVRETFLIKPDGKPFYRADDIAANGWNNYGETITWKPSIFMPRWASRITLKVTAVRVERVQDISNDDAHAEGISKDRPNGWISCSSYRDLFRQLWNSINAKRGYSWESNPWVWVVEFEKD